MPPDIMMWVMAHPCSNEQSNVVNKISSLSDVGSDFSDDGHAEKVFLI
jgi:hypothetical protein